LYIMQFSMWIKTRGTKYYVPNMCDERSFKTGIGMYLAVTLDFAMAELTRFSNAITHAHLSGNDSVGLAPVLTR
jgi:hypothetical protein